MTWLPKSTQTVETSHWTSSILDCVPLHSSSRLWDLGYQIRCKLSSEKRTLDYWATGQFLFSLAQVWHVCCSGAGQQEEYDIWTPCPGSVCGGSWCSKSSLSPLLVKLPQTFCHKLPFPDNPVQAAVIPAACAPFSSTLFPSTWLSINVLWYSTFREHPTSFAITFWGFSSLWRVSRMVFCTTVRSAVFPNECEFYWTRLETF